MKRYLFYLPFLLISPSLYAQQPDKHPLWETELAGGLNNYDAWEIEPSITFYPLHYTGITMGLLFTSPYHTNSPGGIAKDQKLRWSCTDENTTNHFFALRPALKFNTPRLWIGEDKDYALYLSVSPGLTIPLPANQTFSIDYFPNHEGVWTALRREQVKNSGGKRLYFHLRTTASFEIDNSLILSVGYVISDFDLYGGSRNITIEGERLDLPHHRLMHTAFVSIGYRF